MLASGILRNERIQNICNWSIWTKLGQDWNFFWYHPASKIANPQISTWVQSSKIPMNMVVIFSNVIIYIIQKIDLIDYIKWRLGYRSKETLFELFGIQCLPARLCRLKLPFLNACITLLLVKDNSQYWTIIHLNAENAKHIWTSTIVFPRINSNSNVASVRQTIVYLKIIFRAANNIHVS